MTISRRQVTTGGLGLLACSSSTSAYAQRTRPLSDAVEYVEETIDVRRASRLSPKELANRTIYRRAVDAVIWGLPLVGEDTAKQAYFRDGKANYNDIVWWRKGGGWKNQSPTPNVNTRLDAARRQSAKFWELRAANDLARLWRDQGKRDEARELLATVYGWFTEGFDRRDLKEAKALLDELAA